MTAPAQSRMPQAQSRMPQAEADTWHPQAHTMAGVGISALVLVAAILLGRPELAAIGAIPLLSIVFARGAAGGATGIELLEAGQLDGPAPSAHVRVWGTPGGWLRLRARAAHMLPAETLLALPGHADPETGRAQRRLRVRAPIVRTGEHRLFGLDAASISGIGSAATPVFSTEPVRLLVRPATQPLPQVPLPHRLDGLTGAHRSRRIGDGGDFHDIHLFTAGDRLRRIDWRTTARHAAPGRLDLYVRRTYATADATIVIAIDSRDDVGGDASTWSGGGKLSLAEATSLDLAREAAASLSKAYLDAGDRVGIEDLAGRQRPLPAASGSRHLERILRQLTTASPRSWSTVRARAPQIPSGALAFVVSTFLDEEAALVARQWHAQGHRVIAVDVLPPIRTGGLTDRMLTAYRMVAMERHDRIVRLRRSGIAVVTWTPGAEGTTRPEIVQLARAQGRVGHGRRGGSRR